MKFNLKSLLSRRRNVNLLALLVAVIMLSLTFVYVNEKKQALEARYQHAFNNAVEQNYFSIKDRLAEMAVILRGIKGHFEASEVVSSKEYHDYFTALDLGERLSGFHGIAVAYSVSHAALPDFLEKVRQFGLPDFKIKPNDKREWYAPITYIEPNVGDNLSAVGFDLFTNQLVKPVLLRAKNTGSLAMTGKISLIQDEGAVVPASVMYIPIYDASKPNDLERKRTLVGWVSGPFRINDFMSSLSHKLHHDIGISIDVENGVSRASRLYGEVPVVASQNEPLHFQKTKKLTVGGVNWTLNMHTLPDFKKRFTEAGYFSTLIGVVLSLMMGWLVWLLGNGHANAVELADEMTGELKNSEATFRLMAETIPLAIYVSTVDDQATEYVNPTFVNLLGYEKHKMPTMEEWWQLAFPTEADYAKATKEWKAKVEESQATKRKTEPMEMAITCENGTKKTISWQFITSGNKTYAFGYDLTEAKLAAIELQIAATAFESQSGMMVIGADRKILRVNKAFEKITGYSLGDVRGTREALLNSGHQDELFYKRMWGEVKSKGAWEGEVWSKRKNGEIYPEILNITSVTKKGDTSTYYVGTFNDITRAKAADAEIQNLAFYDPLTQLPNRRYLLDKLNHALAISKRKGQSGALFFLDLDDFKTLNDTLGHDAGDLLLKKVAERLADCVRESDTVSRLGGDEFVLLFEGFKDSGIGLAEQLETIGHNISTALSQPYDLNGRRYFSTASIGITMFGCEENSISTEDLLRQADIAMYQAKAAGRNTLRFFDPEMQEAISARAAMEIELRNAIKENQFQLYYQTQVDRDGKAFGVEALIRWQHPDKEMVPPIQFIPLAEDTGLIVPIGQWVLETACKQLIAWQQDSLTQHLSISVNVSAKQFHQQDFSAQLKTLIAQYGINPSLLKLELTESLLLADVENTIAIMSELKKAGVHFELDDFGTGYSSLRYLKELPLSKLKIDKSFVRDIAVDSSDKAIVLTIITMAHTLGLEVIAEGVETEEQWQYLQDNDCVHFQGYLFSKPLPISELEVLLQLN